MRGRDATALTAAAALSLASCTAKLVVTHVPDGSTPAADRAKPDGVFYALPRTVVKVDLPVERTEAREGRFVQYADLFVPHLAKEAGRRQEAVLKAARERAKPAERPVVTFRLGNPVFSSSGEPDPTQVYFVKVTGGFAVDRTASVDYTEQGAVQGAEMEAVHVGTEVALGALGAVSGILTRTTLPGAALTETVPAADAKLAAALRCAIDGDVACDDAVWDFFDKYAAVRNDPAAKEAFSRYCQLDPPRRQAISADVLALNPNLLRAYDAFQRLHALQRARDGLFSGQQLGPEPLLRDLDAAIARELATSFVGSEVREQWSGGFEARPQVLGDQPRILKFSAKGGVCEADLRGKPAPPAKFKVADDCADSLPVVVAFRLDGADQLASRVANHYQVGQALDVDRSYRYRIPMLSRVSVVWQTAQPSSVGEGGLTIAQFGPIVSLPAKSGGRSLNYDVKFYESTGGLKSFKLASKSAIQKANVDSLSSSANALLDARLKQQQEEAKTADELNQLERRRKILEEQVKIRKACADLGIECGP